MSRPIAAPWFRRVRSPLVARSAAASSAFALGGLSQSLVPVRENMAHGRLTAALLLGSLVLGAGVSCSGATASSGPPVDPERMSVSEYDLARDVWLRQNRPREALAHAIKASELDSSNADALHLVALLYLDFCSRSSDECRLAEAERYARAALEERSDYREARNTLGVILIHAKRPDEAIIALKPLAEDMLYQTPEIAWGNLGWAYLEAGRVDQAIDALRRSVAAQPLFCVGHYRLGLAHERRGQPRLALQALDRALDSSEPRCARMQAAYSARARVELRLGQHAEAASDIERCIELDKTSKEARDCQAMRRKLK